MREQKPVIEQPQPLELFRIQSAFASKASVILHIPLEEALLNYTTFYKRIGVEDWKHEPQNSKWQEFIKEVENGAESAEAAYSMYMRTVADQGSRDRPRTCFSYDYEDEEKTVSIHFRNNFATKDSPLADSNIQIRQDELMNIFREVKEKYPEAEKVKGGSWLYSYDTYRRLFPPEYTKHLEEMKVGYKGNAIWGQFLQSSGKMNIGREGQFLKAVESVATEKELFDAFPLKFYKAVGQIGLFYYFYNV